MSQKYVRFKKPRSDTLVYGILGDDVVTELDRAPWSDANETGVRHRLDELTLAAPVEPSKIVCIGLNYRAHISASLSADMARDYPLIFLKPPSSVIGPGDKIIYPRQSKRVDYEAELGVVIGRTARNVSQDEAEKHVFGFTCVNDVTARDLQKKDGQWSRAKGFDTFCPVGPWIVKDIDYRDVLVEGILNGDIRQSGRSSQMIFDVPYLVSHVSGIMTLYPGDLIATGTPAGIAPMRPGDEVEVRIEQIGSLKNTVV